MPVLAIDAGREPEVPVDATLPGEPDRAAAVAVDRQCNCLSTIIDVTTEKEVTNESFDPVTRHSQYI